MSRVLVIIGSEKPPTFILNQVNGLRKRGVIELAVLARPGCSRYLPGVDVLKSDFDSCWIGHMVIRLALAMVLSPRILWKAKELTTFHSSLKVRLKFLYRMWLIVRFNPDVVHFQWAGHISEYEKLIKSERYVTVVSLRGTQINVGPLLNSQLSESYKNLFPHCYFHAVSHTIASKAIQFGAIQDRIRVIYSPVPSAFPSSYRSSSAFPRRTLKVVSVGRFHWIKGYTYALEAIRLLSSSGVQVLYSLIAPGKIPTEVLYQLNNRGLGNNVLIQSNVEYEEMPNELLKHDVLLLSSVEEGIANVVLEAMAVGLPVVSTDCGGMREVVESGVNGWLVPIRDSVAIADALRRVAAQTPQELDAVRRAASEMINSKFNFEKCIAEFEEFYSWVIREGE